MARNFKKNRSDSYQWILLESPCSPEMLTEYSDCQGLTGMMNYASYNEELLDLKEQLNIEQWRLIDTELTPRQRQVIRLYADGYTQIEIAKMLKVNQSSITKSINGNCDYRNGRKVYGGAKKKLRKIAEKDSKMQEILKKIAELQESQL